MSAGGAGVRSASRVKSLEDPARGGTAKDRVREPSLEPLPPLVSAALEPGDPSPTARIERLNARCGATRYTVLGEVAQGGMGRILRAWDESLGREVAMKVVPRAAREGSSDDELADHERRLLRFLEEARITGQLDHPGIVPVYECGLDETGNVFFTMPLLRGQDLKRVFDRVHRGEHGWTRHRAVDVMLKVCQTVAFAHAKGVVHRDLKPENIMVGRFGETYVLDWGLALLLGRSLREGIVGTPAYMSPEQAAGRQSDVGPRSDVYSLGAILYELLARRMPHEYSLETASSGHSFEGMIADPPRPLRELGVDVSPELAAICDKAMARRPEERYSSALEMADDLAAWLAGRVVSAHPTGFVERLRKWRRRNRELALALDGLVALALVAGGTFLVRERVFLRRVEAKHRQALIAGYAAALSAADLGLRAHETGDAKRRLAACEPGLRGWEWRHLMLDADSSERVLAGHEREVRAVAVSPDGTRLASGSDDGSVALWTEDGTRLALLTGHAEVVTAVAFAPDGRRLATASEDSTVRLWDVARGALLRTLEEHRADVRALAFSEDGRFLVSGDVAGTLVVSAVADGAVLGRHDLETHDPIVALDVLPGSERVAAAHMSAVVRCYDLPHATLAQEKRVGPSTLQDLAAARAGQRIAVAYEHTALVLDAHTLAPLVALAGHEGKINGLAFSPDGQRLATCGFDHVVRVWDVATGTVVAELAGHDDSVNALAFFPDGRRLVTGSEDRTLRLWDLEHPPVRVLGGHGGWVDTLAFAPSGSSLASGSRDRNLRIWETRSGALLASAATAGPVDCVAWSARDEVAFGCGDPVPRIASPAEPAAWRQLAPGSGFPRALAFDSRGEHLAWRDSKGLAYVLALDAIAPSCIDPRDETATLALSADGSLLATGTLSGDVQLWDARSGARRGVLHGDNEVRSLAFDPEGQRLAAGRRNRSIVLFSVRSREVLATFEGHESLVSCLTFSPDGSRFVSGSYDGTLRVWSPDSAESLLTLHGHTQAVTAVAFDAAGETLASSSKDGTIRLWRTADVREALR